MQSVVELVDLTKVYGGNTVVDKLNLSIEEGEVFGFLGPNGAGKTTTILMLLGLTEPTSGVARVCGYNSTREPLKVKRVSGYIPERVGFYEELSADYNLKYTARLNGLPRDVTAQRVKESLAMVGLAKEAGQKVGTFSRGMKQRLAIADILVKMPRVAIMDEPTSGIDPKGVNQLLDLIAKIAREHNMTIILSSHQLQQVQRICNRVGILAKGKMVMEGMWKDFEKRALGGGRYTVEVHIAEITPVIIDSIKKIEGVSSVERSDNSLLVSCSKDLRPQIAKAVVDNNGLLEEMKIQSYSLEDIYMRYFKEA